MFCDIRTTSRNFCRVLRKLADDGRVAKLDYSKAIPSSQFSQQSTQPANKQPQQQDPARSFIMGGFSHSQQQRNQQIRRSPTYANMERGYYQAHRSYEQASAGNQGFREGLQESDKAVTRGFIKGVRDIPENVAGVVPTVYKWTGKAGEAVGVVPEGATQRSMESFKSSPVNKLLSFANQTFQKPFNNFLARPDLQPNQDIHVPGLQYSEGVGYFIPTMYGATLPTVSTAVKGTTAATSALYRTGVSAASRVAPRAVTAVRKATAAGRGAGWTGRVTNAINPVVKKAAPVYNRVASTVDKGNDIQDAVFTTIGAVGM